MHMTKNTINKIKRKQETQKSICNICHKIRLNFPFKRVPTHH